MTLPIYYVRSRGIPGIHEFPLRLEVTSDGKYVVRACKFILSGVTYDFKVDYGFTAPEGPFSGVFYETLEGNLGFSVLDPDLLRHGTPEEVKAMRAHVKSAVLSAFMRASVHNGVEEDCIVVYTFEDPSSFDENGVFTGLVGSPVRHGQIACVSAACESDFPPYVQARTRLDSQKSYQQKLDALKSKSWNDLTAQEREFVMVKMAERMGIIAPTVADTVVPMQATGSSAPTGSAPTPAPTGPVPTPASTGPADPASPTGTSVPTGATGATGPAR